MSNPALADTTETLRYLAIGLGAALGTYRVLSHILEQTSYELSHSQQSEKKRSRRNAWYGGISGFYGTSATGPAPGVDVSLSTDALSQLALKSGYRLRKASAELMFDNAMSPEMLALIIKTASDDSNSEMRLRVVRLIQAIVQSSTRRMSKAARAGGIEALVNGMRARENNELALSSVVALMEFLNTQEPKLAKKYRRKAADCGLLEAVHDILELNGKSTAVSGEEGSDSPSSSPPIRSVEVSALVTACANIAKLYALRSAFHKEMIDLEYLPALLCVAKNSVADMELMRAIMESIVRLCTYLSAYRTTDTNYDINPRMTQLLELGAVDVVAACIRQDDQGVSSWGIGLLHEFVSRGVGKQELASSPRVVQWLCRKLSTAKYAYTNQLILRSLWCLCITTKSSLVDVSQPHNLRRILCMFVNESDTEAHYWSIALISRVSVYPTTHAWILDSPLPRALKGLINSLGANLRATLFPEIANIISRMCHSIPLASVLGNYPDIATACHLLLSTDIENAQLSTAMAIINATATSRGFLKTVVNDDLHQKLLGILVDFKREQAQNYAAKCLVALLYSDFVPAELVVGKGLLPYLNELCASYQTVFGKFFPCGVKDEDVEDSELFKWQFKRLSHYLSTASVLLSALQLYLAEVNRQNSHYLADSLAADAVSALGAYQMCLLAQASAYIVLVLDFGNTMHDYIADADSTREELKRPPVLRCSLSEWARSAVNCFIATYYRHSTDDAHYQAAVEDGARVKRNALPVSAGSDAATHDIDPSCRAWQDSTTIRLDRTADRWTGTASADGAVHDQPKSDGHDDDATTAALLEFTGDMRDPKLRCTMPILRAVLGSLADSLEPGLMVQAPCVTRRLIWLVRILHHEFPSLRAVTMRLLSVVDIKSLNESDAAGVVHMACSFLADTMTSARGLVIDMDRRDACKSIAKLASMVEQVTGISISVAEKQPSTIDEESSVNRSQAQTSSDKNGEESAAAAADAAMFKCRVWHAALLDIGLSSECDRSSSEYYERYPEQDPGTMALAGWFHARFAVDCLVAGWKTCIEQFSCVVPPPVAHQGSDCWIIDRSGPQGPAHQRASAVAGPMPTLSPCDTGTNTQDHGASDASQQMLLTECAVAGFSADILPLVSSPHLQPGHHSHSSASSVTSVSSSGSRRRSNRPQSPFPATIFSDPSVDADGDASAAVSRPPHSLLVSPPTVMYYNNAPYFPAFVALADGCTVWNSSWKFESARMRTGIDGRLGGVYRFQVQLLTSGLLQIGWCTDRCSFYPESGEGVGDDFESVAYDGYRQRKWHGTAEEKAYGEKWRAGDVIAAELDLDNDRVVFYRNGVSLGLAFGTNDQGTIEGGECGFKGLARDRTWYPAFSLASEQGLVFLGSGSSAEQPLLRRSGDVYKPIDKMLGVDSGADTLSGSKDGSEIGQASRASGDISAIIRELRLLGVTKAFKIRFEFQDLDTFPCIALTLPANMGQITVGPLTHMEHLSTYLQPQWWATWTGSDEGSACSSPNVRDTPAPDLARWFASCVAGGANARKSALLTSNMTPASWVFFTVLADGRVCVAVEHGPGCLAEECTPVVFEVGAGATATDDAADQHSTHVWLPTVSSAVVSFDCRVICA